MADDIVTELRDWAAITDEAQGKAILVMLSGQVFADAADEIERLRAVGDALIAAIRNHDLREQHIKAWEARRG